MVQDSSKLLHYGMWLLILKMIWQTLLHMLLLILLMPWAHLNSWIETLSYYGMEGKPSLPHMSTTTWRTICLSSTCSCPWMRRRRLLLGLMCSSACKRPLPT